MSDVGVGPTSHVEVGVRRNPDFIENMCLVERIHTRVSVDLRICT